MLSIEIDFPSQRTNNQPSQRFDLKTLVASYKRHSPDRTMTTATMKVPRATFTTILMMIMTCPLNSMVAAFLAPTTKAFHRTTFTNSEVRRYASTITRSQEQDFVTNEGTINDGDADEVDIDFLFEEPEIPYESLDSMEKVWRYAKKPLLRIGSKGATHSHGNSLRQLLDDHTVVKVKCNLKKFGKSLSRKGILSQMVGMMLCCLIVLFFCRDFASCI